LAPLAAINLAAAPPQRVFTLFHELGHLCLGLSGVSDAVTEEPHYGAANVRQAEVFCNRFASSLLLPLDHRRVIAAMDDLAGENTADDHRVGMVASRFRVSKYVLLHRMRDSGRLDRIQANRIIGTWVALDDEREEQRKEREREKRERDKADGRPIFGLTPVQNALSALGSDIVRDVLTAVDGGRIGEREAADLLQTSAKHFGGLSEKLAAARSHG
jgi:Zn-dependent peptidase ImmA (M78 family)